MKYDKKILEDPSAPVMALIYVIVKNYTTEAFNWNPQLLRNELEEDFDLKLTDLQSDKIQAGITVLTTNMYESDVRTFEVCTRLLTHNAQDFEDFQPLEAEELVAGLTEVMLIKMEDITFGDDVRVYAGEVFHEYGLCKSPDLFPDAIMPSGFPADCDDTEKNKALSEIFNATVDAVTTYMNKIK
jgi:hypothetical protein